MAENKQEILKSICRESFSPLTKEPYQATANGVTHELATDAHILLAFPVGKSELPALPTDKHGTQDRMIEWLSRKPEKLIDGGKAGFAFYNFLNLDGCIKCPACKGSGKRPVDFDADNWIFDPFDGARYIRIDGHDIDANRLVRMLVQLPIVPAKPLGYRRDVGGNPNDPTATQHTFYGEGWILFLMGCREDSADKDAPNWTEFQPIESK